MEGEGGGGGRRRRLDGVLKIAEDAFSEEVSFAIAGASNWNVGAAGASRGIVCGWISSAPTLLL